MSGQIFKVVLGESARTWNLADHGSSGGLQGLDTLGAGAGLELEKDFRSVNGLTCA